MQHRQVALLLSIIPGLGQFYNKQWIKGIVFLFLGASFFAVFGDLLNMGFWGIFTLGTEVPRDNSVFLLAEGIIAVIVTCFGLAVYYVNLRDAFQSGKQRDENKPLSSLKEQYQHIISEGYPYVVSGPSLFILIFAVIFPILFSFALAFTNYDLYHSPPAKLIDWVGFQTFANIFTVDIWRSTFLMYWLGRWFGHLLHPHCKSAWGFFSRSLLTRKTFGLNVFSDDSDFAMGRSRFCDDFNFCGTV